MNDRPWVTHYYVLYLVEVSLSLANGLTCDNRCAGGMRDAFFKGDERGARSVFPLPFPPYALPAARFVSRLQQFSLLDALHLEFANVPSQMVVPNDVAGVANG